MSENCPECKNKFTFYDGAHLHNPKWVCANCGFEKGENEIIDYKEVIVWEQAKMYC